MPGETSTPSETDIISSIDELLKDVLGETEAEGEVPVVAAELRPDPERGVLYELQGDAFGTFRGWIRNRP